MCGSCTSTLKSCTNHYLYLCCLVFENVSWKWSYWYYCFRSRGEDRKTHIHTHTHTHTHVTLIAPHIHFAISCLSSTIHTCRPLHTLTPPSPSTLHALSSAPHGSYIFNSVSFSVFFTVKLSLVYYF